MQSVKTCGEGNTVLALPRSISVPLFFGALFLFDRCSVSFRFLYSFSSFLSPLASNVFIRRRPIVRCLLNAETLMRKLFSFFAFVNPYSQRSATFGSRFTRLTRESSWSREQEQARNPFLFNRIYSVRSLRIKLIYAVSRTTALQLSFHRI